jgi:ATP-dependent RNA helicase DDX49/DBP8
MLIGISLQRDICLLHEIEDDVGNRFDAYECDDKEVTKDITKVCYTGLIPRQPV